MIKKSALVFFFAHRVYMSLILLDLVAAINSCLYAQ